MTFMALQEIIELGEVFLGDVKRRSRDIYGAGVGSGLAWDISPTPGRDKSRGYAPLMTHIMCLFPSSRSHDKSGYLPPDRVPTPLFRSSILTPTGL